jgi:hydroxymethylpyrimidine pyrophosphatase-like HAD family hydrolase
MTATKYRKVLYVFDMDDTLIESDRQFDRDHDYMVLHVVREIDDMMDFFRSLREAGEAVYILTTRHPAVRPAIAAYFGIPQDYVLCRQFALERADYKAMVATKDKEDAFVRQGLIEKIEVLNRLSAGKAAVMYFDDKAEIIWTAENRHRRLSPMVFVTWPQRDLAKLAPIYQTMKEESVKPLPQPANELIHNPINRGYLSSELEWVMEVDEILGFKNEDLKEEFNQLFPAFGFDGFKATDALCPAGRMFIFYQPKKQSDQPLPGEVNANSHN